MHKTDGELFRDKKMRGWMMNESMQISDSGILENFRHQFWFVDNAFQSYPPFLLYN